jgi:hypothetical protein
VLVHQLLPLNLKGTRDPGGRITKETLLVLLNKDKDLITGETTTIMIQMILETTMGKSDQEGRGVNMERKRMTMLLHPETDQEGITTMNKSQLTHKYLTRNH